jgi:hypothetical protein
MKMHSYEQEVVGGEENNIFVFTNGKTISKIGISPLEVLKMASNALPLGDS